MDSEWVKLIALIFELLMLRLSGSTMGNRTMEILFSSFWPCVASRLTKPASGSSISLEKKEEEKKKKLSASSDVFQCTFADRERQITR